MRREGTEEEVSVEALRIGDTVLVNPNERLPADGFVIAGSSAVDQVPITGESVPVDKSSVADIEAAARDPDAIDATSRVFAGTINGSGALEVRVTRAAADSTLARVVKMVRDGVNDAPAIANATVGITMGAAGSDVALETADVALMADNLDHLPFALELSRRTRGIIRQNLYFSLGVVVLLIPATICGLGIGPAVALHEG